MGRVEVRHFHKCNCQKCYACDGTGEFQGQKCPRCIGGIRCRHPEDPRGTLHGLKVYSGSHSSYGFCKLKGAPE